MLVHGNWRRVFGIEFEVIELENVLGLRCIECGEGLPADPGTYTCPSCGSIGGIMDVEYDYKVIN